MLNYNLIGQVFGQLTVVERGSNLKHKVRFYCICSCGTRCLVRSRDLRTGNSKSCGCSRRKKKI